jgi:hypothetical protein
MSRHQSRSKPIFSEPEHPKAYCMEVDDMPIGVALSADSNLVFHATDRSFFSIDGRRFRHINQVSRAVRAVARDLPDGRPGARRSFRR